MTAGEWYFSKTTASAISAANYLAQIGSNSYSDSDGQNFIPHATGAGGEWRPCTRMRRLVCNLVRE